jgi:hypothetical protein
MLAANDDVTVNPLLRDHRPANAAPDVVVAGRSDRILLEEELAALPLFVVMDLGRG